MRKYIIFDMDLTLVDTTNLEADRHKRDWNTVYSKIPSCYVYEGFDKIFETVNMLIDNGKIINLGIADFE